MRNEIIRKKMQKTVLKQGIQISTMQIVGVRIVMCATLQAYLLRRMLLICLNLLNEPYILR